MHLLYGFGNSLGFKNEHKIEQKLKKMNKNYWYLLYAFYVSGVLRLRPQELTI